jgi:glycosyltransferase involved in cell wall biosynthesis
MVYSTVGEAGLMKINFRGIILAHISLNLAGGGEKVCLELLKVLRKCGYPVVLASVDRTNWRYLRRTFKKIYYPTREVYLFSRLPNFRFGFLNDSLMLLFFLWELLLLKLARRGYVLICTCGEKVPAIADVVYVSGFPLWLADFLPNVSAIRKCYSRFYRALMEIIGKIHPPAVVVANSRFVSNFIKRFAGKDVLTIHPPINLYEFVSCGNNVRQENIVVVPCRFLPNQNLEIVPKIAKLVENADFLLIGPAPSAASTKTVNMLHDLIGKLGIKNVTFLINPSFSHYFDYICKGKVLLRTPLFEAFGMSVVEAMAAGCVPVVPRCGGPWFDILDCKQGVYGFSYRSVGEAAEIIGRLLEDDVLRESVASRARERARLFDGSIFEKKILDLVDKFYRLKFKGEKFVS